MRDEYEAIEAANFSTLKELARSPAHYQAALKSPREATDAMDLGTAFHLLTLEPEKESASIAVWDEGVRRGKAWDAFKDKHAGKLLLTRDNYETAASMAKSVLASPQARKYLGGGRAEVTLQFEIDGVKCKGRADYLSSALLDLKSTRDGGIEGFGRQMFTGKVHCQMAMYRLGVRAMGADLPVRLVAVENFFPFTCQVYRLTEAQLEQGEAEVRAWIATLKHCRAVYGEKPWPGYWPEEADLQFPRWANPEEVYL